MKGKLFPQKVSHARTFYLVLKVFAVNHILIIPKDFSQTFSFV